MARKTCKGMGLIKGTEAFGQCMLKLIDESRADDQTFYESGMSWRKVHDWCLSKKVKRRLR